MSEPATRTNPKRELIREAIKFLNWAGSKNISPGYGKPVKDPDDTLWTYCEATGDEDWDTLADRIADSIPDSALHPSIGADA